MPGVRRIPLTERNVMSHLRYFLTAFLTLLLSASAIAHQPSYRSQKMSRDDGTRRGFYYNCGYGYAFHIPKGLVGRGEPDGHPQHGVRIWMSEQPESYVWIDGSFNSLEWQTLDDAAKFQREALNDRGKDVSLIERQAARLGRLKALRLTFSYVENDTGSRVIEEVVVAQRRSKEEAEIIYTIGLKTPQTTYQRGKRMLESVLQTWQLKPLPCA